MPHDFTQFHTNWRQDLSIIREAAPESARAFGSLHASAMKEGALSTREKELIALAIGLAQRCTGCICLHAAGAKKAGATREQAMEAAGVAVMMQGGPAFVHFPLVIAAFDLPTPT